MKFMPLHYRALLPFCLMALGPPAHAADLNCDLPAPPKSAAISSVHGYFVFMFPRAVASHYTGCRTIWGEEGRAVMTTKYKDGVPTAFVRFNFETGKPKLECRYKRKALETALKDCPSYARMVEDAEEEWSQEDEADLIPHLKPEQDPRRD